MFKEITSDSLGFERAVFSERAGDGSYIEDLRTRDADMDGDVRSLLRQLES